MKMQTAILIASVALLLAGCADRAKKAPATPAAPQPAPAAAKPTPAEPLSLLQTEVKLPPAQPVDPEALALALAPPPTARVETAPPKTTSRPRSAAAQAAAPAPPPVEVERAPVRELLDPAESKRLKDNADGRKRAIRAWLTPARARRLNQDTVARIQSLLKASDDAEAGGSMREASALADRALILMRELQNGK